jgi:hypothetical protein
VDGAKAKEKFEEHSLLRNVCEHFALGEGGAKGTAIFKTLLEM